MNICMHRWQISATNFINNQNTRDTCCSFLAYIICCPLHPSKTPSFRTLFHFPSSNTNSSSYPSLFNRNIPNSKISTQIMAKYAHKTPSLLPLSLWIQSGLVSFFNNPSIITIASMKQWRDHTTGKQSIEKID